MEPMNYSAENYPGDQVLVEKVLKGDTNAFRTIIRQTEALVAQVVFKMVYNQEDRKDIVQDVYMKAFHSLAGFRFHSKLSTWIAQIAYNTCISYLDKKNLVLAGSSQEGFDLEDEYLERMQHRTGTYSEEPEKQLFRKELSGILKKEIDGLPPIYKLLITLFHNEEMSYTEIGNITGLPEGTIKSYLFRARKTLRENLLLTHKKEAL
jgi:RNA polymerase sigma factor (sigma-70 family)